MSNEFIFDDSQAGFRLNTFQIYNWGVLQNNKIFTFSFDNKSTLLTGRNGSGKTTLVDAIITLMVPKRYRFYNQSSSGDTKDKDRNEESYVLGAYGTASDESSLSGKTKYLRDKNCISIINGIFCNEVTGQTISLIQIRYFTSNELVMYAGVTEEKLLIEDINNILKEENAKLDRDKKWRQILKNKCGTDFWDHDNFSKYAARFKNLFGLREDSENKALKLFAQIVGMKELGNLNEFIRQKMIEGVDVDTEFENLQDNYEKLIQCENEIAKTKRQLELLEPVVETGRNIEESNKIQEKYKIDQQILPGWYAQTAIGILQNEIADIDSERNSLIVQNEEIKNEIENLGNDIEVLSNNSGILLVNEKERQINDKNKDLANTKTRKDKYISNVSKLNLSIPNSEDDFEKIQKSANELLNTIENDKEELKQQEIDIEINKRDLFAKYNGLEEELSSLGTRSSNIPNKNISIRKQIAEGIGISEQTIPFVGELLQIKESEKDWEYAIERLLHNLALTLLVDEANYKQVTEYVNNHDLNGRVVYLRTDLQLGEGIPEVSSNTVLGKLSVKEGNAFSSWIEKHIYNNWNYICSDDFSVISKHDKVLSIKGLYKNGIKHEKDDSPNFRQRTNFVLGWDNLDKRKALSTQIENIREEQSSIEEQRNIIVNELKELEIKTDCIKTINEFKSFYEIDTDSIIIQIQKLIEEKKLIAEENNVVEIEKQISYKRDRKKALENQRDELNGRIGEYKKDIENKTESLNNSEVIWNSLIQAKPEDELLTLINHFIGDYEIKSIPVIKKLDSERERISKRIDIDLKTEQKSYAAYKKNLGDYMRNLTSPKENDKKKYGDWTIQFADLQEDYDYIADWINCYEQLKKDELPKYQKQFKEYLNQNLNADIIKFKNFIDNGNQEINKAIATLNTNLKQIPYGDKPKTYLQLRRSDNRDQKIIEFNRMLKNAIPNAAGYQTEEEEEKAFRRIKDFIDFVKENEKNRKYILDLRNWHSFGAPELKYEDDSEANYHSDSNSLSGGEKAKLTYTILASAIAYQFGINDSDSSTRSLRFVIVDEVFSKSDSVNAQYAMQLFKQLDLQVMIVTPLDKLNIAEEYISSVHQVQKIGDSSRVISLTMERFRESRAKMEAEEHD